MSSSENTSNKHSNPFFNRLDVDGEDGDEFIDRWDTGELLFLSSSVLQSDKNWVSVARSIKPYGELNHPPDWYTPKNCALQYTKLLDEIDDDSVKKALPRTERETPEVMLVKNLTEKRLHELESLNQQTKAAAETLRLQMESLENGDFDENLDELLKELEEQERREKEQYDEYLTQRENLNRAKKLNRSQIARGKSPANMSGFKKKASVTQNIMQKPPPHLTTEEIYKNDKIKIDEDMPYIQTVVKKTEDGGKTPASMSAQLNSVVSVPSSVPQSSPLLTSLLSSVAYPSVSQNFPSIDSSVIKKPNLLDNLDTYKEEIDTMAIPQECLSTHLGPKSPPSTSDSSPLLNSLLQNSPSAPAHLFTSPEKEISPNPASSPQPFFNPTSALATSAAQQLSVATFATSNQQIFQQLELPENHQKNLQFFKAASSCSAAPTLSKLLEMPPSTPGKLPPLPVVDSHVSSTLPSSIQKAKNSEQSFPELSSEAAAKIDYIPKESPFPTNSSILQKSLTSYSLADKKNVITSTEASKETLDNGEILNKKRRNVDDPSQASIDILEALCESIEQMDGNKNMKTKDIKDQADSISKLDDIEINKFYIEDMNNAFTSSDRKYSEESDSSSSSAFEFFLNKSEEAPSEEDKKVSPKKFYRSRASNRKEDVEKSKVSSSLLQSTKESIYSKSESESENSESSFTCIISSVVEAFEKTQKDLNSSKLIDSNSSVFKNTVERSSIEKIEMIEDVVPVAPRAYSRRGKRRRGRPAKSFPTKQVEPADQYEFTESNEDNSVVYRTSNTLCYMPRVKEDFQLEDSKGKASPPMESEGMSSSSTSPSSCRKNAKLSSLNGEPASFQLSNAPCSLFESDEKISDSMTSDEASNHFLNEDKFKKWEETCGENGDGDSKNFVSVESAVMGIKSNESLIATESNKQIGDVEAYESLQGLITTVASPPLTNETEGQESPYDKQDLFSIFSPRCSETILPSSEESEEDESDNWDNQSASTNKSSYHSSETRPRLKRKERDTAEYKAWKKAISIVLREVTCHKNANIFLQKVTNDVAPGYLDIVHRPMDLSLIKKNIDMGVIRTTDEFHRDMLLMFQNAIMYNSSDHDVHQMAVEMQRDVVKQISAFLATQSHNKEVVSEPSSLRGARTTKSHKKHGKQSTANFSKQKDETD